MSDHSPTPWQLLDYGELNQLYTDSNDHTIHISDANGKWICQFWSKREEDFENPVANARLMLVAPEMLEALEIIAAWEPTRAPDEPGGMSIMEAIDIARLAIAKARGEQHESVD